MCRGWSGYLAGFGLLALSVVAPAHSVETESVIDDDGQSCTAFRYDLRDLADQRESDRISEALAEHQGKTIRSIQYDSRDIFDESDPSENNWLYRGFNRLHIQTRDPVIAAQLLFAEGDELYLNQIQESERILRRRGYLTSAFIVPKLTCQDSVELLVVTRDSWVTEPEVTFSHEGGETTSSFGIKDGNFLGTGDSVTVSYARDIERNSLSYEYATDHFMQSRWATRLYFAQKSDGEDKAFSLERPFYALSVPWATGGFVRDVSEIRTVREGGVDVNEFRHRNRDGEVYFGIATRADEYLTRRWLMGLTREEDVFSPTEDTPPEMPVPRDRKGTYAWLGIEVIENKFATYRNLYQIQRTEDIALGVNYSARFGYGGASMGNASDLVRYQAAYSNVIGVGKHHILQLQADLNGYHYSETRVDSGTVGAEIAYNLFQDENNRWFVRLRYDLGRNLEQYEELTLGGGNGLRGYPIDYQRGQRRYLMNLERRYFSDVHLFNVVRMGGVAYFDAGRVWDSDISERDGSHLSNIGIGLRFSSSKARIGNILHIDLAMPLAEKSGLDSTQLLIKTERRF